MTNNTTTTNADRIAKLEEELARQYQNRLNTNGHGRRARIQEEIDRLERDLAALFPEIGILNRDGRQVFYLCSPFGQVREFASLDDCRRAVPKNRRAADREPSAYDVHRRRLELEGFRLGADAEGFDVYRHQDGDALAWINIKLPVSPVGRDLFTVKRGDQAAATADRISCLVKRRRGLLVEIARADKARTEEIHAELEATAAELEQLSTRPAAELAA
jgi:hypothetical protein